MSRTFERVHQSAAPYSLVSEDRMRLLWQEAEHAPRGCFVEVGVYRGGTAMLLNSFGRELHLFDTFQGHPATQIAGLDDGHWAGRYGDTGVLSVAERCAGATIHVGEFPATLTDLPPVALVHCDVDLYQSTTDVCEHLVPKLVPGGVLICDDYGHVAAAKQAIDEYIGRNPSVGLETPDTGQAILRTAA